MVDLGGRVELEVHVRQRSLQLAQRLGVVVELDVRVLAVHAVDLGEPRRLVLRDGVRDELVRGERERVLLLARLRKGAELALHAADVRLVQVEVLDEVDLVAAAAQPARQVGELAEREHVVRFHQHDAVLEVEALPGLDLLAHRRKCVQSVEDCHSLTFLG